MTTEITMETVSDTGQRKVHQGRRVIGFVQYFPEIKSIGRAAGWTFIPNRADISDRCPKPSPVFDDPNAVLAYINATLSA